LLHLFTKYNISVDEMMTSKCCLLEPNENIQSSGFAFYILTYSDIQEFGEDEERYLMSREDR